MKRWIAAALSLGLAACAGSGGAAPASPASPAGPLVILISLDGFPACMFDDPRLPVPTLQRLMREGASAKGMTIINPTVTWPNHTTLATGVAPAKHGVLYNGLLTAEPGKPAKVEQKNRSVLVKAPTVYDAAHAAGLTTAEVDWVPPQTGGTITWAFEENPSPDGPIEREMVAAGLITAAELADFKKGNPPWRDLMWTRAAAHIVKTHRPNLLLFHLLNLDATHHKYGPKTPAALSAIALADARVAELLAAVEEAGLTKQTTVVVVSDHGFKATKRSIRPNAALVQAGYAKLQGGKIASCMASVVPEGGTAMVYLRAPESAAAAGRIRELLKGLEGVDRLIEPDEYLKLGMPLPKDNPQMADFVLVAKPGYGFAGVAEGEPVVDVTEGMTIGLHGYVAEDPDMNAIFIAWGRGIRKGARIETLRNVDVAPTVAALLGLTLEGVDGRAVSAVLE
ncbi:MAG TPA: alkaline phosphatase family protein [Planctomycetota bacterium]|nr:alkaline phosphatase family protein [Planctomycetota bacterium]